MGENMGVPTASKSLAGTYGTNDGSACEIHGSPQAAQGDGFLNPQLLECDLYSLGDCHGGARMGPIQGGLPPALRRRWHDWQLSGRGRPAEYPQGFRHAEPALPFPRPVSGRPFAYDS